MSYESKESQAIVPFIQTAMREDVLSEESLKLLANPLLREQVSEAMGTPASEMPGDDLTIITFVVDDSGSMVNLAPIVRKSQNRLIDRLMNEAPRPESILLSTQALNTQVIDPYRPLFRAARLNERNYQATGGTPLVQRTIEVAGTVLLKGQEARDDWKTVRSLTLIMSDGGASDSRKIPPSEARGPVGDTVRSGKDIMSSLCICYEQEEEEMIKFYEEMGFQRKWNLVARNNAEAVEKALDTFIDAAVLASDPEKFLLLTDGMDSVRRLQHGN